MSSSVGGCGVQTQREQRQADDAARPARRRRAGSRGASGRARRRARASRARRAPSGRGSIDDVEHVDDEVDDDDRRREQHDDVAHDDAGRGWRSPGRRAGRGPAARTRSRSTTVPVSRLANCRPITVSTGTIALRSTWRHSTRARRQALGARGADEVLAQHVEHRRARDAREDRRLHDRERERRQHQRAAAPAHAAAVVGVQPGKPPAENHCSFTANSQDQQDREPEVRDRDADLARRHHADVAGAVVARRGVEAERRARARSSAPSPSAPAAR